MDYKTYHNCLRIQITNDEMQEHRIRQIAEHCARYGIDNVMLTINQEEFNQGHIPLDLAKPWIAVLKKAKKVLEEKGLSVSLNNWIEIGHCDRGKGFAPGQDFQPFTDMNGRAATDVACPLCENWRRYFAEYASYLTREIQPDTFWLEDDFRLHNHAPLDGVGCFCPLHMKRYNQKLGTNYTREEFVEKVFAKGPCNPERKAWLDVSREVMPELADFIATAIKKVRPETDLALMTSRPAPHCLEARDWDTLLNTLAKGGHKINRIHLPYGEITGKQFLYNLNMMSMPVRALNKDDVIVMPEIEHGAATLYNKSPRFFQFTLEASIPLVLSGSTYSIYDFIGNGARDSFRFGPIIQELQPYMQGIRDLNLRFSSLRGVTIPIEERACYFKTIKTDRSDLEPIEYHIGAYLSGLGLVYRYSTQKDLRGETLFLTGSNIDYFSDTQLKALFAENFVLIDAAGALSLAERGLLALIGADRVERMKGDTGLFSYEECADKEQEICGVQMLRASARRIAGDAVKLHYTAPVTFYTHLYNHRMEQAAPGFTAGAGFAVFPFFLDEYRYPLFADLRRHFLTQTIAAQKTEYVCCDFMGISPYLFKREQDHVLMLINGNVDPLKEILLDLKNIPFREIYQLNKQGQILPASFERSGDRLLIKEPLEHLSSAVFILK